MTPRPGGRSPHGQAEHVDGRLAGVEACARVGDELDELGDGWDVDLLRARRLERSRELPVVVDFWAAWRPLPHARPRDRERSREACGEARLVKIDVDAEQTLAARYGIQSIPTVAVFRDGEPVTGFIGAYPPATVGKFLDVLAGGRGESPTSRRPRRHLRRGRRVSGGRSVVGQAAAVGVWTGRSSDGLRRPLSGGGRVLALGQRMGLVAGTSSRSPSTPIRRTVPPCVTA